MDCGRTNVESTFRSSVGPETYRLSGEHGSVRERGRPRNPRLELHEENGRRRVTGRIQADACDRVTHIRAGFLVPQGPLDDGRPGRDADRRIVRTWGEVSISDRRRLQRGGFRKVRKKLHDVGVLLGDVILVQPDAYAADRIQGL